MKPVQSGFDSVEMNFVLFFMRRPSVIELHNRQIEETLQNAKS